MKVFEYYKQRADLGDKNAMTKFGIYYKEGKIVKQDYLKAIEYYLKASNLGDGISMTNLGVLYSEGRGVKQDYLKAIEYFKRAIEVGIVYENGVRVDYSIAVEYYMKAIQLGCSDLVNVIQQGKELSKTLQKRLNLFKKPLILEMQVEC